LRGSKLGTHKRKSAANRWCTRGNRGKQKGAKRMGRMKQRFEEHSRTGHSKENSLEDTLLPGSPENNKNRTIAAPLTRRNRGQRTNEVPSRGTEFENGV